MALGKELVDSLEIAVQRYGAGLPVSAEVARSRLAVLGVAPDDDYVDFVSRWGGCFVGVTVHAWENSDLLGRETCDELTRWARADYGDLIDGVVIADDGSGNPIWIAADGAVRLQDHDNGETVMLAPTFASYLEENVHD